MARLYETDYLCRRVWGGGWESTERDVVFIQVGRRTGGGCGVATHDTGIEGPKRYREIYKELTERSTGNGHQRQECTNSIEIYES